jgi:hypothetical protein
MYLQPNDGNPSLHVRPATEPATSLRPDPTTSRASARRPGTWPQQCTISPRPRRSVERPGARPRAARPPQRARSSTPQERAAGARRRQRRRPPPRAVGLGRISHRRATPERAQRARHRFGWASRHRTINEYKPRSFALRRAGAAHRPHGRQRPPFVAYLPLAVSPSVLAFRRCIEIFSRCGAV